MWSNTLDSCQSQLFVVSSIEDITVCHNKETECLYIVKK